MKKIFSAIISSSLKGRLGGILFALLATTNLWAYDFQFGDFYYNITSDTTVEVTYQSTSSSNYSGFTSVTIPETVTYNGTTYSVTTIEDAAFIYCSSLTSVTIPNSVTSIGNDAFSGCSSLISITIPNSVTSIGNYAFSGCSSLTAPVYNAHCFAYMPTSYSGAYTIPEGIKQIAGAAFYDCSSLTSITIPHSVTSIEDLTFYQCSSLTSITIGNSVTSIGSSAFSNCTALTSITIPNSVTSIGDWAFGGCSSLPVENNLRYADTYLVEAVDKTLSTCSIKEGTKWIGDGAFSWCSSLTSITIPNSVTSIGDWAFYFCISLKTVICEAIEVPWLLGGYVFYDMPLSEATLYVPAQSLDDYKAAEQWKEFGRILPLEEAPSAVENTRLPIANGAKLLRDGQLLILRDGKTYTITGQRL